jgi:hypothetical protein
MDERDKIIREDYPIENLPEDLREGLGGAARVRVTVEPSGPPRRKRESWAKIETLMREARSAPGFKPVTSEEAVARVRELRDEWDR